MFKASSADTSPAGAIPSYLIPTAYGERASRVLAHKKRHQTSGDHHDSTRSLKDTAPGAGAALAGAGAASSSGNGVADLSASASSICSDRIEPAPVNADDYRLPQIYMTRSAALMDARGDYATSEVSSANPFLSAYELGGLAGAGEDTAADTLRSSIRNSARRSSETTSGRILNGPHGPNPNGPFTRSMSGSSGDSSEMDDDMSTSSSGAAAGGTNTSVRSADAASDGTQNLFTSLNAANAARHFDTLYTLEPLPRKWRASENKTAAQVGLEDGCSVAYRSDSKRGSEDWVTFRTDSPIPQLCGIYYYEVEIKAHGVESISIGLCSKKAQLKRMPGMEPYSWGLLTDDGRSQAYQEAGKSFGSKINVGDVVGCGYLFSRGQIFYTKNGLPLGTAFTNVKPSKIYPCVGIKIGGAIETNFGERPFKYDMDRHVRGEKADLFKKINSTLGSHSPSEDFIKALVFSYLYQSGYVESARHFNTELANEGGFAADSVPAAEVSSETEKRSNDPFGLYSRREIRNAVLSGDMDAVIERVNSYFPEAFETKHGPNILFEIKCQKFVELVRSELETRSQSMVDDDDIDDQAIPSNPKIIAYGKELTAKYSGGEGVEGVDAQSTFSLMFNLVAYPDPSVDPVLADMLDESQLSRLADSLDKHILRACLKRPEEPSVVKLIQHTSQLLYQLSDREGHESNLINVYEDYVK